MIRVRIRRSASDRSILSFQVQGHAEYDKPGRDIVCAGVSAVAIGTVNAVEALTGVVLTDQADNGLLQAAVPAELTTERKQQVDLLLESMLVMLRTIEQSYGKYITITEMNE
jgi:hypothetical protein